MLLLSGDPGLHRPEVMIAAVLFLMTRYQRSPCPAVARAIADHFSRLARHGEVDESIRSLCAGLRDEWERAAIKALLDRERVLIH